MSTLPAAALRRFALPLTVVAALLVTALPLAGSPARAARSQPAAPVVLAPQQVEPTQTETPTPTPTAPPTPTPTAPPTPTATPTPPPGPTPTASPKPSTSPGPSASPKPSTSPAPSGSPKPTIPPTPSPLPAVMPTPVPATEFARVYRGSGLWLRRTASNDSAGVIKAPKGQIVGLLGSSGANWYRATYRGKVGYVPASRLQRVTLAGRGLAQQYARVIVLARRQQHMEVWENGRLMLISAVTTGRPELPTPTGTMRVLRNESPHLMRSPWGPESPFYYTPGWAHYTVMFKGGGFYFHDTRARPENGYGIGTNLPHRDPDGATRTGSRGCANTPMWAMRQLYGWARVGDTVVIMDEPYSATPVPTMPEAPNEPNEPSEPTEPTIPTDPTLPPGTIDPPKSNIRPPMPRPYVF